MHKYLEIIHKKSSIVVKRFDVTNKTDRSIERLEDAISINMNRKDFRTSTKDSESPLELDPKVNDEELI